MMDADRARRERTERSADPRCEGKAQRRRLHRAALGATAGVVALAAALLLALSGSRSHASARVHAVRPAHGAGPVGARRPPASAVAGESRLQAHILSYTSYIALGTHRRRELALTFDDGPGPYTAAVLAVLQRFHAPATFFEIGRNVSEYPQLTARLARAGMVIGDHTEEHPAMARLDASAQAAQLDRAARAIRAAGGGRPLLFRPPYGSFDPTTLRLLRERDMLMVLWSADTSDYARPGVRRIVYIALSGAQPGAIILFHDGGGDRSQTVAALPRIIERLRQRGYRLVTVPELLRHDPPPAGQPAPASLAGD
jgi:peptidoglycan-N-acetylglucosamine deacetylase